MIEERTWNAAVKKFVPASGGFLQSFAWGEFQKRQNREVRRILVEDEGGVMLAQAIRLQAPLGLSYWLVPKGPLGNMPVNKMRAVLVRELGEGVEYIRTESRTRFPRAIQVKDTHPQTTRMLDLTGGYDVVFQDFNAKTRYNTRLAAKKGVVTEFVGLEKFDAFASLMTQTSERDAFSLHELSYYQDMIAFLQGAEECDVKLALASIDGVPLAVALTVDAFGVRTYLHGASGNLYRELKAPQALQNFCIRDACKSGLYFYDFWGIAPPGSNEKHPWWGISRFKEGFGGYVYATDGTFDIPVHGLKYGVYRTARFTRKLVKKVFGR